ncbi:MAG: hypothetical protein E7444_05880 [Ruminococcaceae bacterium]|nr:hypothetical protein [Oscillospiraceae bacterium]
MGKHPNLNELEYLFEKGVDFHLTAREYEKKTGIPLPKDKNYIKNGSALARRVAEHGFEIIEIQEKPVIERTVYFKKK